ncbi:hypothetical protein QSV37_05950 [Acinetobacter sp. VNK23]|uniref:hypothetical protein n=1 Tax=Acinetobacter thutiue TaxID=2998078 RepID=UPI00257597D3|nr:hypothetical protein [Acinetobacter thutiue]MDM1019849.1 hypothetical protein [Acinetobacter thutiue]
MKSQESLLNMIHNFLMISTLITFFLVVLIGKIFAWFFALSALLYVPILFIFIVSKITSFSQVTIQFGCISAGSYCILVLLKLLPWSWFILIFIYIAGMFAHQRILADEKVEKPDFIQINEIKPIIIEKEQISKKVEVLDKEEIIQRLKTRKEVVSRQVKEIKVNPVVENELFLLIELKAKYSSELNFSQNKILNEIHDVFSGFQQRISQTNGRKINREIKDILKVTLKQLLDSMAQYVQYPKTQRYYPSAQHPPSPQQWLTQHLDEILQQLIEVLEVLYREDLESFLLHSQFIQEKLKPNPSFKVGEDI